MLRAKQHQAHTNQVESIDLHSLPCTACQVRVRFRVSAEEERRLARQQKKVEHAQTRQEIEVGLTHSISRAHHQS